MKKEIKKELEKYKEEINNSQKNYTIEDILRSMKDERRSIK